MKINDYKRLKVGEKVLVTGYHDGIKVSKDLATILFIDGREILFEFVRHIGGHDGNFQKLGKNGHCWYFDQSNITELSYDYNFDISNYLK